MKGGENNAINSGSTEAVGGQTAIHNLVCIRTLSGKSHQEQLETYARDRRWPEPLPKPLPQGASRLDRLDRKTLVKLWEESERMFKHRSADELMFFQENGYWPEQRLRPRYYVQDGCFSVEWQLQSEEEDQREKN